MPTVEQAVKGYIALRDKKNKLAERHAEEMLPVKQAMEALEGWLQRALLREGVKNMSTGEGVAFLSTVTKTPVKDRDAFLKFVAANNMYDLLESRASKSAVMDYYESTGEIVPGVDIQQTQVVRVNRR